MLDSITQWLNTNQWAIYILLVYIAVTLVQIGNKLILKFFKALFKKKTPYMPQNVKFNNFTKKSEAKPFLRTTDKTIQKPLPLTSLSKEKYFEIKKEEDLMAKKICEKCGEELKNQDKDVCEECIKKVIKENKLYVN